MNRRHFLTAAAGAAAFATLPPRAFPADAPRKQRELKKGYFLNAFPNGARQLPLAGKFKLLKEAGFDGVEPPSHLDQEEVLQACSMTGLTIASVSCGAHSRMLANPAPGKRAEGAAGIQQALRDANRYGASSILVVPGLVDERITYTDNYKWTQEGIRQCLPLAEELGVTMAIENVWNNFLLSPIEAARYVDEFNSKFVGWHFDVGNVMFLGWPEQWIRILGRRIQKIHIKEYSRKKLNEEGKRKGFDVEYLEGDNNWPAIMKALDEIGYRGWAIVEPAWRPEGIQPATRLKQISERLDKIIAS
jgi:L-ribulose-5-phosphate 3-epimerase